MSLHTKIVAVFLAIALAGGCATQPYIYSETAYVQPIAKGSVLRTFALDGELEERILALNPETITADDVHKVLARGPAPRIINLHGGIYPVHLVMDSFAEFLIGMGYPEGKIRDPREGSFSHSPYESSERLAGSIAWYYEREGMRPMLIGHSQGGMQAVKVLHQLAGAFQEKIRVWNPITDREEDRTTIIDPLTGEERSVVGLSVAYASAVGAGGATFVLPNQWRMAGRLRTIPDAVDEFTGFALGLDLVAWDLPGLSGGYQGNGKTRVRNVQLPASYSHVTVAASAHLAHDPRIREWIDAYAPSDVKAVAPLPEGPNENALWAADVWYSIKKHWCLEAQRLVRALRQASVKSGA
jgi:hypothetical protein